VLDSTVDLLERLAEDGPALEFAIGTGRVGIPLAARGVPVVIDLWVPPIQRLPHGEEAVPMSVDEGHLIFDTYDLVTQQCVSHHYNRDESGSIRYGVGHFRYIWPSECDLMAQLAGFELESRSADWTGSSFLATSDTHVSVWRKA
jgi:hypothetical protein